MYRYEIRIPARMPLKDMMEEITSEAWIILNHRFEGELAGQYKEFQNQVHLIMTPYLERFSLCGTSDICTDEARKVFGDHKSDSSGLYPETRIYHLMLPGTFKEFVDELTSKTLESIGTLLNEQDRQKARVTLTSAFRLAMGKYLYHNSWCGKAQICRYSFPIDPWINFEVVEDPELTR